VPPAYFKASRREYRNWRQAWVREVVQNAVDAGATFIDFIFDPGCITVRDNGSGMTEDVLVNKFLCLGGSHKEAGSTGGFGYAKTLICFSWDNYSIETNGLIVAGSGGSYSIGRADSKRKGTTIKVHYLDNASDVVTPDTVTTYLAMCDLPGITFSINGQPHETPEPRKEKPASRDSMFHITLVDNKYDNEIIVRKNGLCMWRQFMFAESINKCTMYVDVQEDSTVAFTANRDGFQGERQQMLSDIAQILVGTPKIARQAPGAGLQDVNFFFNSVATECAYVTEQSTRSYDTESNGEESARPDLGLDASRLPENFVVRCFTFVNRATGHEKEITKSELRRLLSMKHYRGLAHAWASLVDAIANTPYAKSKGIDATRIHAGLMFGSTGVDGLCAKHGQTHHVLVNAEYFEDDNYFTDLMDVALHEVAHVAAMSHGEEFTMVEAGLRRALRHQIDASLDTLAEALCDAAFKGRPVTVQELYPAN
jgi:hypothetical protein